MPSTVTTTVRPYQQEALDALLAGLAGSGRGQLHAACGTGKTLMAAHAAARLVPGEGLLVAFAPSLALVAQIIREWRDLVGVDAVLAVCGDDTVADAPARRSDIPAHSTTDPDEVLNWLRATTGRRLVVATYYSGHVLAGALRAANMRADLAVHDEAHHLAGRADYVTRRILDERFLPARRRLFMTATPRQETGRSDDVDMLTMSDPDVFGPVLYAYPWARGISEGYLDSYRVVIMGVAQQQMLAFLKDDQHHHVDDPTAPDLKTLAAQTVLAQAARQYGLRRVIAFCHRVDAAGEFARSLPATLARMRPDQRPNGDVQAARITGEHSHAEREEILDTLRHPAGAWTVIANVRCLTEGVDVPTVDGILFTHPKTSRVDIVQAVGRALRRSPDGTGTATIIVPIPVPDSTEQVGDLAPGDYQVLWDVLRALRSHDETLALELDRQRSHGHRDNPQLPSRITIQLPPGTSDQLLAQLTALTVRQTTSSWWDGYAAAAAYQENTGHLAVPLRHVTDDGFRLGQWVVKQRQFYGKSWLPADRVQALENLGIEWDPSEARWQQSYAQAKAWRLQHGHLDVPQTAELGGQKVGDWIVRQRRNRRDGTLSQHRIDALDALGMIWEHRSRALQRNLDALAAYQAEHGHTDVPLRHVAADGVRLGSWVSQMRAKRHQLSADRIKALDDAGFTWTGIPSGEQARARALAAARSFHAAHGHLEVPGDARHDGVALGTWIARQRQLHRAGELPDETVQALTGLGMRWTRRLPAPRPPRPDPKAQRNQHALDAATRYAAEHGHLNVPHGHVHDGVHLGNWLHRQRTAERDGHLPDELRQSLDALGMRWFTQPRPPGDTAAERRAALWDRNLAIATRYAAEHGHLNVPTGCTAEGLRLDAWLYRQRRAWANGQLTPQQQTALTELGWRQ
ncbi:Helicase associated domain protein [Streptomyces virginiae]|uniref:DEAD/DEAH box helicase n=1 Tax=Streptomyces virginiae TaxID=1961 RepID=UPI003637EEA9